MSAAQPKRTYLVPKSTRDLLEKHLAMCQNLHLRLHRYVPEEAIQNKEKKLPDGKLIPPQRAPWLQDVALNASRVDEELWQALYQRWLALTRAAGAVTFQAKLAWRMVVGLGGQSVLETDLTLDHLSGLPIIPGSALKGLTRAYAVLEVFHSSAQKPEDDPKEVQRMFGSQDAASHVSFFDAMPVPPNRTQGRMRFAVDIMNPHYPDYYRENGAHAPSNDQSPVPVTFLTVEGATFEFAVAPRTAEMTEDSGKALEWLKEAVQHYGVGGKTSAGYGAFRVQEDQNSGGSPSYSASSQASQTSMTREEALARLQGRKKINEGTVQERTEEEALVKFKAPKIGMRGLITKEHFGGRALAKGNSIPPCDVLDVLERDGEWFVLLRCPPK